MLGLFGAADRRPPHRARPAHRSPARVGRRSSAASTLVVALTLNYLAGGAFQSRYSALVFPFFIVLVARGFTTLARSARAHGRARGRARARLRRAASATSGPTARRRARSRRCCAPRRKPGDLVVYCPDQLGPAVHRLAPPGLDEVDVSERSARPKFVDWVDYKKRLGRGRSGGVRAQGARPGRGAHALVRDVARLHHASGRVRDALDAVRDRADRATSASRPTTGSSSTRACRSSRPRGRRAADRTCRHPSRAVPLRHDGHTRAVVVPFVLSRVIVVGSLVLTRHVIRAASAQAAADPGATGPARLGRGVVPRHRAVAATTACAQGRAALLPALPDARARAWRGCRA